MVNCFYHFVRHFNQKLRHICKELDRNFVVFVLKGLGNLSLRCFLIHICVLNALEKMKIRKLKR